MGANADFPELPLTAVNRAQLSRIRYAADDVEAIRERLLARMAETFPQWNPALALSSDRPDLAVLFSGLFAHMAGILNAYSDARINESFLRTAVLERSLIDLTALIDYRLAPGASATGMQAFIVKEGATGPVPAGFKVQAPPAGATPAIVFETSAPLEVSSVRNRLRLDGHDRSSRTLRVRGSASTPQDRNALLDAVYRSLKPGVPVVFDDGTWLSAVPLVSSETVEERTRIEWPAGAPGADRDVPIPDLVIHGRPKQAMRLAAAARADELPANTTVLPMTSVAGFSIDEPVLIESDGVLMAARVIRRDVGTNTLVLGRGLIAALRRSATRVARAKEVGLAHGRIPPGATQISLHSGYTGEPPQPGDYLLLSDAAGVELTTVAGFDSTTLILAQPVLRAMRPMARSASGHPAIGVHRVPADALASAVHVRPLRLDELSGVYQGGMTTLQLDRVYEELVSGGVVALSDGNRCSAHTTSSVSASDDRTQLVLNGTVDGAFRVAQLRIHAPFEYAMRVEGHNRSDERLQAGVSHLDLIGTDLGLAAGACLILDDGDASRAAEGVRVTQVAQENGLTRVSLARPLERDYALASTVVYGNAVPISHGASVPEEVLGSGNPAIPNQRFALRLAPLTFVPDAADERGVRAALEIFVDAERWTEVKSLAASGPADHHYVLEVDDTQRSWVCFGDGVHGAPPASGRNNIRVRFRTGLGRWANVARSALTQMPTPLPILASSMNLAPTGGGADREVPAVARRRAAHRVRTLDRAVALADFAELAMNFAGVAKARADRTRDAGTGAASITVTLAGEGGAALGAEAKDAVFAYLRSRMPGSQRLNLRDAERVPTRLALTVTLHSNVLQADVLRRLLAAFGSGADDAGRPGFFSFDGRELGEDLHLSAVYALAERVSGVDHVLATAFHPEGMAEAVMDRISVPPHAWASGGDAVDSAVGRLVIALRGGLQ